MNDLKTQLIKLNNNLEEVDFDLIEFQETIKEIDKQYEEVDIYSSFCNILEVDEATRHDFDQDTMSFIDEIQYSSYVDIENLRELDFEDITERLNLVINIL